ncbi:DoxX family protein [Nonomuraea sp. NBC_01738]|uniref:DoxX family protein n=1 Tax=Nonomuraea sp. NBC_01738 TaxID=2976003 RepID=UPI002E120C23|nr:DoxX family protein [Nonomuraea sp. NBC_01738]
MNVALWILQILLALLFLAAGLTKMSVDKNKLRDRLPYVEDYTQGQMRAIGAIEAVAAVGLVLPEATGIAPVLTPLAAAGLAITMVLAALVHRRRKESIAVNLVLLAVALVIAIGRFL